MPHTDLFTPDIQVFQPCYTMEIQALIVEIQQQEFDIPITLAQQSDLQDIHSFYCQGKGNFWVAVDAEQVVGTIALLDIGNGNAALRKMFVKQAYRGKKMGIAKRLLDVLLLWSQQHDIKNMYLGTTEKFLAAHRFYEQQGFQEISTSLLPAGFPIMAVDVKFYHKMP